MIKIGNKRSSSKLVKAQEGHSSQYLQETQESGFTGESFYLFLIDNLKFSTFHRLNAVGRQFNLSEDL